MNHVDDRHFEPHPCRDLRRKRAAGVHQMLANDVALVRHHLPLTTRELAGVGHLRVPIDGGSTLPGPGRHRVGTARRVGMTVIGRVRTQDHPLHIQQRTDLLDLVRPDQMTLGANVVQHALHLVEPIHLVRVGGKPNGSTFVPTGRLTRLCLERPVQVRSIQVDLRHIEIADKLPNQPGCVPGRTGSQFALLHQHRIRPPFLDQVVEQTDPHGTPTDDHDTCMSLHPSLQPDRKTDFRATKKGGRKLPEFPSRWKKTAAPA